MKPWTRSSAVDPNGKQSLKFMNLGALMDKNAESAKMSYGVLMIGINTRMWCLKPFIYRKINT
jgi:hypothetical protein